MNMRHLILPIASTTYALLAQVVTGSISGNVPDSSGSPIPGKLEKSLIAAWDESCYLLRIV